LVPTLVHDGTPVCESTIIDEYIDTAFEGPKLVSADPLKTAHMREFIRKCETSFDAIVKLTFVRYILPKLRNRWGEEELIKQAQRRPTRFYGDIHARGVRGEITEVELAEARATILELLDGLERTLDLNCRPRIYPRRYYNRPLNVYGGDCPSSPGGFRSPHPDRFDHQGEQREAAQNGGAAHQRQQHSVVEHGCTIRTCACGSIALSLPAPTTRNRPKTVMRQLSDQRELKPEHPMTLWRRLRTSA
jgi:hypothetical protein